MMQSTSAILCSQTKLLRYTRSIFTCIPCACSTNEPKNRSFQSHDRGFNYIANNKVCQFVKLRHHQIKFYSSDSLLKEHKESENTKSYLLSSDPVTYNELSQNFVVYENFVTEEEEESLMEEIQSFVKRLRYEYDHWDNAIHGYREVERRNWSEENQPVLQRVRDVAFPKGVQQLAHVHVLDLDKAGYIKPHIDAVRFCGNIIAGMSLLSSSVMRLVHNQDKQRFSDILLQRRSLYIMKDAARFDYTHEVLGEKDSIFDGKVVPRDRRVSIIFRNEPDPNNSDNK